jgi:riboflavin synthase
MVRRMFTGIVREIGRVETLDVRPAGARIAIRAPGAAARTKPGDSVSVNGVCLTAVEAEDGLIRFDAVPETLARTTLGRLAPDAEVNVEPALRAGEPLGGHLVQGHVDGVARVRSLEPEGDGARLTVELPPDVARLSVEKGSITLDGVSLTIAALGEGWVAIALVPHTLAETTLGRLEPGDELNAEADVVAKHVERLLGDGGLGGLG